MDKPREKIMEEEKTVEMVEVKIKVPKQVVAFAEALCAFAGVNIDDYWINEMVDAVRSILHSLSGPYIDGEDLEKHYGLQELFDC